MVGKMSGWRFGAIAILLLVIIPFLVFMGLSTLEVGQRFSFFLLSLFLASIFLSVLYTYWFNCRPELIGQFRAVAAGYSLGLLVSSIAAMGFSAVMPIVNSQTAPYTDKLREVALYFLVASVAALSALAQIQQR
ncbi:MAG: hypothetical protein QW598_08500 [Pyrobaculum sp.]